jgi:hypothetical protein
MAPQAPRRRCWRYRMPPRSPSVSLRRAEPSSHRESSASAKRHPDVARLETTGGRSAPPGEWRRRRPGGVAGVTACRPGALRSPFAGQSPAPTGRVQPQLSVILTLRGLRRRVGDRLRRRRMAPQAPRRRCWRYRMPPRSPSVSLRRAEPSSHRESSASAKRHANLRRAFFCLQSRHEGAKHGKAPIWANGWPRPGGRWPCEPPNFHHDNGAMPC